MLNWLVITTAAACFFSFMWGVAFHFRREAAMPASMARLSALSVLCFVWFVYGRFHAASLTASVSKAANIVAVFAMTVSGLLFFWSVVVNRKAPLSVAFSGDIPSFIQKLGPYAYVRHPFYLSYLIFWMATAVASAGFLHWCVPAVMLFVYQRAARLEESKFMASYLAPEYALYKSRTGMLLPATPSLPAAVPSNPEF